MLKIAHGKQPYEALKGPRKNFDMVKIRDRRVRDKE